MGKDLYRVDIKSPTGITIISDEPLDNGGKNLGFSPTELLASSLAACSSITLRMYADRKKWDLAEVRVDVELKRDEEVNKTFIERKIGFSGNLTEEQKKRLILIATKCPLHKILTNIIEINTISV